MRLRCKASVPFPIPDWADERSLSRLYHGGRSVRNPCNGILVHVVMRVGDDTAATFDDLMGGSKPGYTVSVDIDTFPSKLMVSTSTGVRPADDILSETADVIEWGVYEFDEDEILAGYQDVPDVPARMLRGHAVLRVTANIPGVTVADFEAIGGVQAVGVTGATVVVTHDAAHYVSCVSRKVYRLWAVEEVAEVHDETQV